MSPETRNLILQEAEFLIRTRGYSAFSYADLSVRVAITKASIHYYFPAKEDLIVVVVREYIERFVAVLARIKAEHRASGVRLRTYANLFLDGFEKGMLPLCGALSAERSALPESMLPTLRDFFQIHLDWLEAVLEEGRADGGLARHVVPKATALFLLSTLEGGTFVGWALAQKAPVLAAFESALRTIESPDRSPATDEEGMMTSA
jgi:TetR/AcrR family transcriptional regulator, transcriptional repressor for nem operon